MNSLKKVIAVSFLFFSSTHAIFEKITAPEKTKMWFSGYFCSEAYLDTRQVEGYRERDELLFPAKVKLDPHGYDINAQPSFYMNAFRTRLAFNLEAPGFGCFPMTKGFLSVDLRGVDDNTVSVLRMREAFFKLLSDERSVLVGQAFHPMFNDDVFPNTVAYGKGTLTDCRVFVPQLRWNEFLGCFDDGQDRDLLECAITAQSRNSRDNGPDGPDTIYSRNGIVPGLYMEFRKQIHFDDAQRAFVGICFFAKRLLPRLATPETDDVRTDQPSYREHAPLMMGQLSIYGRIDFPGMSWKANIGYCQDGRDTGYISGYAVKTYCPETGEQTYTPLRSVSGWFDFDCGTECRFSPGFFVSFTQNLGAGKPLYINPKTGEPIVYGEAARVRVLTRAAPRLWYYNGPLSVGFELEWTRANHGKLDRCGAVYCDEPANNLRLLLAVFYNF